MALDSNDFAMIKRVAQALETNNELIRQQNETLMLILEQIRWLR